MSARPQFIPPNTKCGECGKIPSAHPTDEERPYLYILCGGILVETKRNNKPAATVERKYKHESLFALRKFNPPKQR